MAYYYASSTKPIQLDECPDDIGVRFEHANASKMARKAVRDIAAGTKSSRGAAVPSQFGRFMVLHESGASMSPVSAVVNALPRKLAMHVARTMPVFVERESQLKLVPTDQILVTFKPNAPSTRRRKLLDGLG